jgi:hypothetical protein
MQKKKSGKNNSSSSSNKIKNAPLFWHDKVGEDREIALPSSSSLTSSLNSPRSTTVDDSLSLPENSFVSAAEKQSIEIQHLRLKIFFKH